MVVHGELKSVFRLEFWTEENRVS